MINITKKDMGLMWCLTNERIMELKPKVKERDDDKYMQLKVLNAKIGSILEGSDLYYGT